MKKAQLVQPVVVTVGSEIMYGERTDDNRGWMLRTLWERGVPAVASVSLPDDEREIGLWLSLIHPLGYRPIFVSGGLGGTHDDMTRQGVARALGRPLVRHEEGFRILEERYGCYFHGQRQRMAWLPQGASLIPNPLGAPGFVVEGVYCFPGFPEMLRPMFLQVLEGFPLHSAGEMVVREWTLPVTEGMVGETVERFAEMHHEVSLGIYPHFSTETRRPHVTVRMRCPRTREYLLDELDSIITSMGFESEPETTRR